MIELADDDDDDDEDNRCSSRTRDTTAVKHGYNPALNLAIDFPSKKLLEKKIARYFNTLCIVAMRHSLRMPVSPLVFACSCAMSCQRPALTSTGRWALHSITQSDFLAPLLSSYQGEAYTASPTDKLCNKRSLFTRSLQTALQCASREGRKHSCCFYTLFMANGDQDGYVLHRNLGVETHRFPATNKTPPHHMLTSPTSATYCTLFFFSVHLQEGLYVTTSDVHTNTVPTYHVLAERLVDSEIIRDGASRAGKWDWGRNGKESAMGFVKDPSQHSPGVISGKHGKPKQDGRTRNRTRILPNASPLACSDDDVLDDRGSVAFIAVALLFPKCKNISGRHSFEGTSRYLVGELRRPVAHDEESCEDFPPAGHFRRHLILYWLVVSPVFAHPLLRSPKPPNSQLSKTAGSEAVAAYIISVAQSGTFPAPRYYRPPDLQTFLRSRKQDGARGCDADQPHLALPAPQACSSQTDYAHPDLRRVPNPTWDLPNIPVVLASTLFISVGCAVTPVVLEETRPTFSCHTRTPVDYFILLLVVTQPIPRLPKRIFCGTAILRVTAERGPHTTCSMPWDPVPATWRSVCRASGQHSQVIVCSFQLLCDVYSLQHQLVDSVSQVPQLSTYQHSSRLSGVVAKLCCTDPGSDVSHSLLHLLQCLLDAVVVVFGRSIFSARARPSITRRSNGIWTALNYEILRDNESEARSGMQGWRKREIPEPTSGIVRHDFH
ncbi:hypothetical protein PR048_030277, partial [Dryococelus australis]